jgi:hypothetical protein
MSKAPPSKPGQAANGPDIHEEILREAKAAQACQKPGFIDADKTPALDGLMSSAGGAITGRIPASFEHEGRTYYLRASIGLVRLMVFASATAPEPLAVGVLGSFAEFGHQPFH